MTVTHISTLLTCSILATSIFSASIAKAEIYIAPFAGYSFGGNGLEISNDESEDSYSRLNISESENFGLMLGMKTNDPGNVHLLYSRQTTDLRNKALSTDVIAELDVNYLHLGGTLYFPSGQLKPYITASAGVTHIRPNGLYSNETHFSMGVGAGVAYELMSNLSVFADVRGYATFMDSNGGLFCNEASCVFKIQGDLMWQGQANIGFEVSF
ncbi:porin family protein [Shewanella gaetbuli]|uniref:Porin family protein n=1 Tax=Shewanella gaetbuli TaxID=220752 RepID=A0A9X2CG06_9GAMM|nr:porin family protein [Shewanella gaetbuli]MCL1141903.1 porin family protein [Shewanella gaetbuli]